MASEKSATYTVRVHPDSDGLWAEVLELPGCFAAGETFEELVKSLEEGIGLYLSDDGKHVTAHAVEREEVFEESREFKLLCRA